MLANSCSVGGIKVQPSSSVEHAYLLSIMIDLMDEIPNLLVDEVVKGTVGIPRRSAEMEDTDKSNGDRTIVDSFMLYKLT